MRKICIVTPLHPSMNPRVVKEADALVEEGYQVSVISPVFNTWALEADREYDSRLWEIVERPAFGPDSPRMNRLREISRRLIAKVATNWFRVKVPALVNAALHPATPLLVKAAKRQKADLYIAHVVAALPAAAMAAKAHNSLYAFDAEDFHQGEFDDAPKGLADRRLVAITEGRYLSDCSYVTAASPLIAEAYSQTYGIPLPKIVLNVFPRSHAPKNSTEMGVASPRPSVYWYSQTIGPNRGLECAVRAMGLASTEPNLYLRGKPIASYVKKLKNIAEEVGASERLHFLPLAPPAELENLASAYDVGFVGETGTPVNRNIQLTNKQFSYLLAGLPVVMSDIAAHRQFAIGLEPVVYLYRAEDSGSLANALDSLFKNPHGLAEARKEAYHLGQERFNWECEKSKLLGLVEEQLQPHKASLFAGDGIPIA